MGRNYFGDINGRFWFAVQPSDAANRFGVIGVQPEELYYYFDRENFEDVEEEIKVIKKKLGKYLPLMDQFFSSNSYYSDALLATVLGVTEKKAKKLLRYYADLELGKQIRDCIKEQGYCEFTAEC